jgi:hypothetical protein
MFRLIFLTVLIALACNRPKPIAASKQILGGMSKDNTPESIKFVTDLFNENIEQLGTGNWELEKILNLSSQIVAGKLIF